jgi:hypothetical protein
LLTHLFPSPLLASCLNGSADLTPRAPSGDSAHRAQRSNSNLPSAGVGASSPSPLPDDGGEGNSAGAVTSPAALLTGMFRMLGRVAAVRSVSRAAAFVAMVVVGSLATGTNAWAQNYGNVDGYVTDEIDEPFAGVTVTLVGDMGERTAVTDERGYYRFSQVDPLVYTVLFDYPGYGKISIPNIQALINNTVSLPPVKLVPGETEEFVIKDAEPAVNTEKTSIGQVLTKDFLSKVPTGRSYQQATQLAAGVTGGSNPNMGGGGSNENQYMVDGAVVTDPVTGTFSNNFNYDAIQQIEVTLGGFDAEYNTLGGIVNLTTETGSNNLQFNATAYYENGDWRPRKDARYTPDGYTLGPTGFNSSFQILQLGAKVSGPLVKDKAFFIFSYQHDRSLIALTQMPQRRDYDGHYVLGKITIQPTNEHRLSLLVQSDPTSIDNISQGNPFQKREAQGRQAQGGFTAQLRYQWFPSDKINLDTRLQVTKTTIEVNAVPCTNNFEADRSQCQPGELEGNVDYTTPGRVGAFGAYDSVNWGSIYFDDRFRFNGAIKLAAVNIIDPFGGKHDLKFGVEGNQFLNNFVTGYSGNTLYVDINEALFNPQTFKNYYWLEITGPIRQRNTGSTWSAFAQDVYKPVKNLTIRYGARVDNTVLRNDVGDAVVNATGVSPRFFAAWDPLGDQKTKISGGWGRSVDPGRQEVAGFTSVSNFGSKLYLGEFFAQFGDQFSPVANQEAMNSYSPRQNLNVSTDNLRLPTTDEFNLTFQRQLVKDVSFQLSAQARLTRGLYEADERNLVYDEDGSAIIGTRFGDPFNNYYRLRTPRQARRNYYRIDAGLTKVQSKRWGGQMTYSFEFMNGTSEESLVGAFVNDPQTRYNYGQLLTVRNHSVTGFGYWDLPTDPWTTQLGFFLNYESGAPLERIYWSDQGVTNGSYGLRIRPRYFYAKFNDFWELSMRIQQQFDVRKGKLGAALFIYNLTNNQAPDAISGFLYQENRLFAFSRQSPLRLALQLTYEF